MLDLEPATAVLAGLVQRIPDDRLRAPTPCVDSSLGDLLDHIEGLSIAFAAAATKTPLPGGSQGPSADGSRLGADWRPRIAERLQALAVAWRDPAAWAGVTQVGGQDLPAEVAGIVALNEVIVHGWDIAVASGQSFNSEPTLIEAAYRFVRSTATQNPHGTPGRFGPPVPVGQDAPPLHRLLGLTGRDPAWPAC
ncbi:MAG: TIGR03086 family metal-binding protein [Actinomycetota bacterium]|nr:TIGR03086 family metal-binding protein [Actinomycetota bacterium]